MNEHQAVFLYHAEKNANRHLLQHYLRGELQEDLCFALWRPSTGASRYTAIIYEIILPEEGDRVLCGDVEFTPQFLSRAINYAIKEKAGLAFMHSHPSDGWQGMSHPDVIAERDVLSYPAMATGLPLLGLTVGTDGYWSARFWKRDGKKIEKNWCSKVRVVGDRKYKIYCNDNLIPPLGRKEILRRTIDTWGVENQNNIARLKIGIVGLGSVGSIVAESVARIGVGDILLIDPDKVKEHNLDRMLNTSTNDIGQHKVDIAAKAIKQHATAESINIETLPLSVHSEKAYKKALDCDVLFSCVDRPVAREVLNYIAFAHLIPVIDGGIDVRMSDDEFVFAHWRSHLVTPCHQCMCCNEQYTTADVAAELAGLLDDQSYVSGLPKDQRERNQNVFPFSLGVAANELNLLVRYLIGKECWNPVQQQDYQFVYGNIIIKNDKCQPNCTFKNKKIAAGDRERPNYIKATVAVEDIVAVEKQKPQGFIEKIKCCLGIQ